MSTSADFDGVVVAAPAWVEVPQMSVPCIAKGGAGGSMNAQAVALTARTNHLAAQLADIVAGNGLHSGSGAPDDDLGANGDFYIDTASTTLYGPKASGEWPSGVSLIGPAGSGGGFTSAQRYTAAGTYYFTATVTGLHRFRAWGGGAGGEGNPGTTPTSLGRGGSGGGYCEIIRMVTAGEVYECIVGAGGAGGPASGGVAASGSVSRVTKSSGATWALTANGGAAMGSGGTATGGDVNLTGEAVRYGAVIGSTLYPATGSSAAGGGGTGGAGNAFMAGEAGHAPGGGGGGGSGSNPGGAGAPGMIEIWY